MENLTETITEKKAQNGEVRTKEVVQEQRFWTAKISWPAIFSGVLVTTVAQMLFSLLGLGIGMGAVNPMSSEDNVQTISIASIAWWSVTMLISLFAGGWATGKMSVPRNKMDLNMHGLLTWATFTVFSFFMLATSAGMIISGVGNAFGTAITAAAAANKSTLDVSGLTNNARNTILLSNQNRNMQNGNVPQGVNTSPETANAGMNNRNAGNQMLFVNSVESFFKTGDVNNAETREAMVNSLMAQTGMSRNEAEAKVQQWINSFNDLKAKAKVKADQAAQVVSTASFAGFFALILGAIVTVLGSRTAQRRNLVPVKA